MSRSNPTTEGSPNPSTRWFEWDGANGHPRYYDKETKERVSVKLPFKFILLDRLSVIKGWHEPTESGITSNEVRDIRTEPFIVKAFSGGVLATGLYSDIRERIAAAGGHFTSNNYVAYRHGDALAIGAVQFKGAALSSWFEFCTKHAKEIYAKSVAIIGAKAGTKGSVKFKTPIFGLTEVTPETNAQAMILDKALQEYLTGYLSRTARKEPSEQEPESEPGAESPENEPPEDAGRGQADDVPF